MGNVSETPTPTTCPKSTAVHLQFVRQYAPHLYRRTFLASKLRRKGNSAIRLPFVLQYASHLYGSTRPICTAVLLEKYWGLGSPERFSLLVRVGNASLFTKFLFTIFVPLKPPPPNQQKEGFSLEFLLKGPQTELRTLSQNCEQTLQKLRTNRIMNKRAFLRESSWVKLRVSRPLCLSE